MLICAMVWPSFMRAYEGITPHPFYAVQILASVSEQIKNFAVIYLVDIKSVPDFNTMYELYDPCTTMFFFRNKVSMCDCYILGPLPLSIAAALPLSFASMRMTCIAAL